MGSGPPATSLGGLVAGELSQQGAGWEGSRTSVPGLLPLQQGGLGGRAQTSPPAPTPVSVEPELLGPPPLEK